MNDKRINLVKSIESVSEQIQVLALNIAVAAAKLSYKKELTPDVNNKLSQLVNQATLAVKNMGMVLRAAKTERPKFDIMQNENQSSLDSQTMQDIENSLVTILEDSQKMMAMLKKVKEETLGK